jgi:hypothetical protein
LEVLGKGDVGGEDWKIYKLLQKRSTGYKFLSVLLGKVLVGREMVWRDLVRG